MQYIFHITKENKKLPIQEVLSLYELKKCKELNESHILVDLNDDSIKLYEKLAYTNDAYKVLFSSAEKSIIGKIKKIDWSKVYKKSFAVRIITIENTIKNNKSNNDNNNCNDNSSSNKFHNQEQRQNKEREFAKIIYYKLKDSTVDMQAPETLIVFFRLKNKYYCCIRIWQNDKSFMLRKPHLKPELHPTSLNPRLAKGCINLIITKNDYEKCFEDNKDDKYKKESGILLLDPFCGVGGILVEAGLLGINVIGVDNEQKMINACLENLNYYGIKDCKLLINDATKITTKELGLKAKEITAIVTDVPYGKNTKKIEHEKLYN